MKRSISVLMMVMMLFVSSFSMNIHGENLDEQAVSLDTDQTVTKLEIRPDTKDGKNKPIHAGGQVEYFLHVASSKTQIDSKNMKVKISIPRSFGNKGFVSQGTGDAIRGYVSYTEENIEITFTTSNLVGGSEISVPFHFTTHRNGLYSNQEIKLFKAELMSAEGNLIASTDGEVEFKTAEYNTQLLMMRNNGSFNEVFGVHDIVAGAVDKDDSSIFTDDVKRLRPIEFQYRLVGKGVGAKNDSSRLYENFRIVMEMPKGAVFDEGLPRNEGWKQEGNQLIYAPVEPILLGEYKILSGVSLFFPGQKVNEVVKAVVHVSGTPVNMNHESEKVLNQDLSVEFKLLPATRNVGAEISYREKFYDTISSRENNSYRYLLRIKNNSELDSLNDFSFYSYDLDDRFYIEKIKFGHNTDDVKGSFQLYTTSGGVETLYDANLNYSNQMITFDEQVEAIRIVSNTDMSLDSESNFDVDLYTKVIDFKKPLVDPKETDEDVIKQQKAINNYLSYEARIGDDKFKSKRTGTIPYVDMKPSAALRLMPQRKIQQPLYMNQRIDLEVMFAVSDIEKGTVIEYTDLVILLPEGYNLYNETGKISIDTEIKDLFKNTQPEIKYDYKNSGKDALVWKLNPFTSEHDYSNSENGVLSSPGKIRFSVVPSMYVEGGFQEIKALLSWDNTDEIPNGDYTMIDGGPEKDILDINDNLDTDELISHSYLNFNFTPPKELIYSKTVKGSLDNGFKPIHKFGYGEIGDTLEYKVQMVNNADNAVSKVEGLNVFAHVGDMSVSEDLNGEKFERHSEFDIKLQEKIETHSHFNFLYTSQEIPEDTVAFMAGDHWQESLDDYTQATAVKFQLKDNQSIQSGEKISFIMVARAPLDDALDDGQHANASLGISTDGKVFNESNLARFELVRYSVSGNVFDDFNEDSIKHQEGNLENIIVKLYGANGVIETHTDKEGNYTFELNDAGEYHIKVELKEGYHFSDMSTDENGSKVDPLTGKSEKVSLDVDHRDVKLNVGMSHPNTKLTIVNKALKADGTDIKKRHEFVFDVEVDDQAYTGAVLINGKTHMIQDGTVVLEQAHIGQLSLFNIAKGSHYKVVMRAHNLFTTTPDTYTFSGVVDQYEIEHEYKNVIDQNFTELSTEKIWINGPAEKETIKIVLMQDGSIIQEKELKDGETQIAWGSLPLRDVDGREYIYQVDEPEVPAHYHKFIQGLDIVNTYVVETFNFNVSKTWVGEALDKITFDLYQNKTKVGTYILDDSNHWNMDFKHYPKTDEYGTLLEYDVIESTYIDYDSTIEKIGDDFIITNTQIIEELPDPEDKPEAELPDDKDPDKELPDKEEPELEAPEETPVDKPVDEFKPETPERAEDETPLDNPKDEAPRDTDKGPDHGGSILPGTGVSNPSFGVAMGLLIVGFIFIRRSRMKKQ